MSRAAQRFADAGEATGLQLFNQQFIDQLAEAISARILPALKSSARLMTVAETAIYIGRTRRAVEHLIERGVIPALRLDNRVQVDREVLDKLISDRPGLFKRARG